MIDSIDTCRTNQNKTFEIWILCGIIVSTRTTTH